MKAITLMQPWATLVAIGAKTIETRDWSTDYRGPLAIHSSRNMPAEVRQMMVDDPLFCRTLEAAGCDPWRLPRGVILATCRLFAVAPTEDLRSKISTQERAFGDYRDGRRGFLLEQIVRLPEPIPSSGALGLWNLPAEVLAQLEGVGA